MNRLPSMPVSSRRVRVRCDPGVRLATRHKHGSAADVSIRRRTSPRRVRTRSLSIRATSTVAMAANMATSKNGKEIWSASLPFTFSQAAITDSGVVAGLMRHLWANTDLQKTPTKSGPAS